MKKSFTRKLWIVMKIGAAQLLIALTLCGVSVAHPNFAQLLDKKISIHVTNAHFEDVLKEIEKSAKIRFAYSIDQLSPQETISLEIKNQRLKDVLSDLFAPRYIQYNVHEKTGTITLKKIVPEVNPQLKHEDKVKHAFLPISGTIRDVSGQPMAGVNIVIKGTTNGTTSDAEGKYTINAQTGDVLTFSFIGCISEEVRVSGLTEVDIVLREDIKNLQEIVVNAGYYATRKEMQTGNIIKIESLEIDKQPVSNPLAALQSRVPGLEVIQQTGVPGGNFKVRIRGISSIANGNNPLYIIDGVPYTSTSQSFVENAGNILGGPTANLGSSPLNSINPSNIESIEILKDADATAIYGSRGANGVILITTKKGHVGKTKTNVNFYSGVAHVPGKIEALNTQQYLEMRREAFNNDNRTPSSGNAPDLLSWDNARNTDWQKTLIGNTARINDAQLSISGGGIHTQFLLGGGFHKESTVFLGNSADQRISFHSNLINASLDQKLKTTVSVNYAISTANLPSEDLTVRALTLPPNAPELFDPTGQLNWNNWTSSLENPVAFLKREYESNTTNLIGNAVVDYAILPTLKCKVNLGYSTLTGDAVTTIPISSQNPASAQLINRSIFSESSFSNWIMEPQMNWNSKVGEGVFDILAGATFLNQRMEGVAQYANGFSSEALMKNIGAAPTILSSTNYYAQYRYHALFGRVNYTLRERYSLNLTARRDGSSRFGPGKQYALFGAIGAVYIFSKEEFFKTAVPFISFGKLRASFGTTGNDQLGDYQYLDTYSSSGLYQGVVGLAPTRLSNPDFAWETNKKMEGAIDLGFLQNRLLLNISYYQNRSSNQLVGFPLAPTTGFPSIQGNFPAVIQNNGLELEFVSENIATSKGFTWTTSLNVTIPRNKLLEFPNMEQFPAFANTYEVGQPLEIKKLFQFTGIDQTSGQYQFEDVNNDLIYDVNDRQTIRFIGRDLYGGIKNSFQYKGWTLDVLFQIVRQQGYDYTRLYQRPPGGLSNQPQVILNRWQQPQESAMVQQFTTGGSLAAENYARWRESNAAIRDASFLRMKNVFLAYDFPIEMIRNLHLRNLNLFLQAQNLITITNYRGLDPEVPGSSSLPPLRTVTAGVHITF